jgi:hypothetical protein
MQRIRLCDDKTPRCCKTTYRLRSVDMQCSETEAELHDRENSATRLGTLGFTFIRDRSSEAFLALFTTLSGTSMWSALVNL